jgi:crotonobetainyl-CoA:carnitine CoA-transferase CaiB-like acyl-CoA transferase
LLAAVIERLQTGQGQRVDISMLDMMLAWQAHIFGQHFAGDENIDRESSLLNGGDVYDFYKTADDRYLAVGSLEPKFWSAFCGALGRPDLVGRRYDNAPGGREALKAELRRIIGARPLQEWIALFEPLDACVEPVLTVEEAAGHPQTAARQMVINVPKRDGTTQQQIGSPYRFSHSESRYRFTGVALGAHTDEVLGEIGYQMAEIEALREGGLLG